MLSKPENEKAVKVFFSQDEDFNGIWKCKCGKSLVQKKGTRWNNLICHIRSQH